MTSPMSQLESVVPFVAAACLAIVGRALASTRPADVRRRAVTVVILAAVVTALPEGAAGLPVSIPNASLAMLALALVAALVWRIPDRMQSWSSEVLEASLVLGVLVATVEEWPIAEVATSAACVAWAGVGLLAGRTTARTPRKRAAGLVLALGVVATTLVVQGLGAAEGAVLAALAVVCALALDGSPRGPRLGRLLLQAALGAGLVVGASWLAGLPWDDRGLLPVLVAALIAGSVAGGPSAPSSALELPGPFEAERETLAVIGRLADPLGSNEDALLKLDHVFPGGQIELLRSPDAVDAPPRARIDRELLAEVCRAGVLRSESSPGVLTRSAAEALRRLGPDATLLPVVYRDRVHGVLVVRGMEHREGSLAEARRFADLLGHRLEAQRLTTELQHKQRLATLGTFAAALMHDLRSPLSTVRLDMQLLQRSTAPQQRASFSDAIAALDRVLNDLSGTLDFTRPLELDIANVELVELARAAVASQSTRAERQGVRLVLELPSRESVFVRGDRSRLLRVLENLVRNALDVSPKGTTITTGLRVASGDAILTVTDEGPGIDPELGERIFEPFVTTKREGVGLGLAIVRKIIEAHDGEISVAARDVGTRMTIALPVARSSTPV